MEKLPANIKDAAALYISRGWEVVPLASSSKLCNEPNWPERTFGVEHFKPNSNIGLKTINGLVDVDCDCPEAVAMASVFLPPTGLVFGRNAQPRHWFYNSEFSKGQFFRDLTQEEAKKATILEIRVNNQTMVPPSIHPSGGEIRWVSDLGEPAAVEAEVLLRAAKLVVTAALVARHYNPPGNRHDWGLSLAGFFRALKITEEEMFKIIKAAAYYVHDTEVLDRMGAIQSTYRRGEDLPVRAASGLKELMIDGDKFVLTLQRIWNTGNSIFVQDQKNDKVLANSQENIRRALDKLNVKLYYDAFCQRPQVQYRNYHGPLEDRIRNRIWLDIDREFHFRPMPDFFDVVLSDIADKNQVHPVKTYLNDLQWDGQPRIDTWLIRSAKAANTEFVQKISSLVLIAAVDRILMPGCKFDELLVLESQQGQMKSSVLRALCPEESWFSDDLPLDVDAKQIIERTQGKWIIEAAELSGMRKGQREHLKSMLSRQVDGPVRMAYARLPLSQPRQFVIVGTTNDYQYLQDPTGNRRFWPVRLERFDIELIISERDQMWAEAMVRAKQHESIRLPQHLYDHATLQQERRRTVDPWEPILEFHFADTARLAPDELWETLGVPVERRTSQHQERAQAILQRMGFRVMSVRDRKGTTVKGWGKGPTTLGLSSDFTKPDFIEKIVKEEKQEEERRRRAAEAGISADENYVDRLQKEIDEENRRLSETDM